MTEKDAVKCAAFADARMWFLRVDAALPPEKRVTKTHVTAFTPELPLLPSGLLGPATLRGMLEMPL